MRHRFNLLLLCTIFCYCYADRHGELTVEDKKIIEKALKMHPINFKSLDCGKLKKWQKKQVAAFNNLANKNKYGKKLGKLFDPNFAVRVSKTELHKSDVVCSSSSLKLCEFYTGFMDDKWKKIHKNFDKDRLEECVKVDKLTCIRGSMVNYWLIIVGLVVVIIIYVFKDRYNRQKIKRLKEQIQNLKENGVEFESEVKSRAQIYSDQTIEAVTEEEEEEYHDYQKQPIPQ